MRHSWVMGVLLFLLSSVAVAQSTPWWELYGGFQFTRADISAAQDLANQTTKAASLPSLNLGRTLNMNGWTVSLQENSASWWGGIIDASGGYANKKLDLTQIANALGLNPSGGSIIAGFDPTLYAVAAGPQFTYRRSNRLQPFTRIMFGVARVDLSPDVVSSGLLAVFAPRFKTTDTSFALLGGGGLDYRLKSYAALRITTDYVRTLLFSQTQNHIRISAGMVFRIGSR